MVAQNDSVLSEAAFQKWPLDDNSGKESELNNLLETLTRNQKSQRHLTCLVCSKPTTGNMKKEELEEGAKSQIEKVLGQLRHFVTEMEKRNKIAQTQVLD